MKPFKTLDIKQTKTVVPERRQWKELNPIIAQVFCLGRVSRP